MDLQNTTAFTSRKGILPVGKVLNLSTHSCLFRRRCSLPGCWLRLWKLHSVKLWDYSKRGIFRVIIKGFAKKLSFVQTNLKACKLSRERNVVADSCFCSDHVAMQVFFSFVCVCVWVCVSVHLPCQALARLVFCVAPPCGHWRHWSRCCSTQSTPGQGHLCCPENHPGERKRINGLGNYNILETKKKN